jgi:hypothetical protein
MRILSITNDVYNKAITTKISKVKTIAAIHSGGRTEEGLCYNSNFIQCFWKVCDKNGHTNFTIAEIDYKSYYQK